MNKFIRNAYVQVDESKNADKIIKPFALIRRSTCTTCTSYDVLAFPSLVAYICMNEIHLTYIIGQRPKRQMIKVESCL